MNLSNNKKSCFIKFINVDHKLWSMNIDLIFKLSKFVFMDQKIWSILMNLKVATCPLLAPGIFDPVMVKLWLGQLAALTQLNLTEALTTSSISHS